MKKILLTIALMLICYAMYAQETCYFILTSQSNTEKGIEKRTLPKDFMDNSPSIFFDIIVKSKNISEVFMHFDLNLEVVKKIRDVTPSDQMEIKTMTQAQVNALNPTDIDTWITTKTKQQIYDLCRQTMGKKVYIIDRSTKRKQGSTYIYTVYEVEYRLIMEA